MGRRDDFQRLTAEAKELAVKEKLSLLLLGAIEMFIPKEKKGVYKGQYQSNSSHSIWDQSAK